MRVFWNSSLAMSDRNLRSISAMSPIAAKAPPTTAPMLVPVMTSIGMPSRTRARSTPMWASPRAAPPPSASPTFRRHGGNTAGR